MGQLLFYIVVLFACAYFRQDVSCKKHGRLSKASDDGKIVGGYNTTIQSVPYQVYLLLKKGNDYYQCGGSIISNRYVLTAAHCLTDISMAYVRAGSTDSNSGGKMYTSAKLIKHPQYNSRSSDYDVGVVMTQSAMTLDGRNTKAVKLPQAGSSVDPGKQILVTGWGTTTENGDTSRFLMAVKVPTVSNAECRKSYGNGITDRMFCAGVPEGGKDSCQGDSGGPAVDDSTGIQVGIVSFGQGCARISFPGVYTRVSAVRTWIRSNTGV